MKSAKEILEMSSKPAVLPDAGGQKDFAPDDSERQADALEIMYQELKTVVKEERVTKRSNLSVGFWDEEKQLVEVEIMKGIHWKNFGAKICNQLLLLPEEALFLVEQGLFELYYKGLPLSVQEAYGVLMPQLPSMEYYQVFAYLCRLGFAVQRFRGTETEDDTMRTDDFDSSNQLKAHPRPISDDDLGVLKSGPAGHLWSENHSENPLVNPSRAKNTAAILSCLQIVKPMKLVESQINKAEDSNFDIAFNVFQSGRTFKKSNPGQPDYRVCICRYSDPPPSLGEIAVLTKASGPVPLKLAVVNHGTVTFYGMFNVDLPAYISKG